MSDNERVLSVDIFYGSSAAAYIDYCSKPQPTWEYLERPFWEAIITRLDLPKAIILDIGSGTGKLYQLLIEEGAKPEDILLLEPNPELTDYLCKELEVICIKDSSHHLDSPILQHEEFNLVTASLVMNHLTTEEYNNFVTCIRGILYKGGVLIYTTPFPKQKAEKHNFDYEDNFAVVEEKAPWRGSVKYHHRSEEYQVGVLEKNGFKVDRIFAGYENFISDTMIEFGERAIGKSLRGPKRIMFVAQKK
jgi:SAM-dependent methyltransferase